MRRFLGCINYYRGSKCKTFYWVDPELPSEYYKEEVFKLLQKVNFLQTKINADQHKIREMERAFDFEKSTLEKQVLGLKMQLKESKESDPAPSLPNWNGFALFAILSDLHLLLRPTVFNFPVAMASSIIFAVF
ncbi:hypothetical protein Tco_1289005 [Tanacetum coccineum]